MLSDDPTLYFEEKKSADILNCQTEVKYIKNWLIYNRFLLIICYMLINSRTIINMYLNNTNIERVTFIHC